MRRALRYMLMVLILSLVLLASIEQVTAAETNPWLSFSLGVLTGFTLFAVIVIASFSGFKVG